MIFQGLIEGAMVPYVALQFQQIYTLLIFNKYL